MKKKIILIGDSVRMGYDKYVKEVLKDVADVFYPNENCTYSQNVLRKTWEWKEQSGWEDVDLVHWNAGLHDVLQLFGDEPMSTPSHYENMVGRIHKMLRHIFPTAKIIFATTTTVLEEGYSENFMRKNSVIKQYNEIALKVLKDTDAIINDLYSVTLNCPAECRNDCTHFGNKKGAELLGNQVVNVICRELSIKPKEVNIETFNLENYTKEQIQR